MATFRKRGAYQWQVQVRRRGFPPQSKTFNSRAEAEAWARELENEMDRGVFVSRTEAERTILREALERYLREVTPAKKGAQQEEGRIRRWMEHPIALRSMASIRGTDIAAYRDSRLAEGRSPITVNNDLIVISHLFTVARKEWGMESLGNPVSNIRKPKLPAGRERRLEGDEEARLLGAAGYPIREIIVMAVETGMRAGEILSLRWDQVDLGRCVAVLEDTKNGERRRVPLSSRAVKTLSSLPRRLDGRVFEEIGSSHLSHRFRRVREQARASYLEECQKAGVLPKSSFLTGIRFHDLRHEATSRLFERGLDLMEVAAVTGHKTLGMLKRYTHLRAEDLAAKLD